MFFRFLSPWRQRSRAHALPELTGLKVVTIASIAVTGLLLGVRQMGWLQPLELAAFDQMVRLRPQEEPDPRLLIVEITEEDIQVYNRFPLSDAIVARLLAKLQSMQPRAIGLDLYRDIPYEPGHEELKAQLAKDNAIAITKLPDGENIGVPPPPTVPKERIGFNDLAIDPDGIVRRDLMYGSTADGLILSFSLRLALTFFKAEGIKISSTAVGHLQLGEAVFTRLLSDSGGYQNIDAQGYQILLNYRQSDRVARKISLTQVLYGRVESSWVKDKIVLIGTTAPSGKDLFLTPYSAAQTENSKMAGVEVHGQILSQILSAVLDSRPLLGWWPEWAEIPWIVFWAVAGGVVCWTVRHPLALTGGTICLLAVLGGTSLALFTATLPYVSASVWVPVSTPILAFLCTGAVVVTTRGYNAGRQQAIVMKLLGQNTSPEIADAFWRNRGTLLKSGTLPGQKLIATMLFTDLKNFSTISEKMPPERLLEWLNELLSAMTAEVTRHHGIVNKFTGDGIMAVFGVPVARNSPEEIGADAQRAVACGLALGQALAQLNQSWSVRNFPEVKMRVGIFTGPIVAGSLGGKDRLEYGVIGDSVNIASRLESCQKDRQPCSCRVLIARETLLYLQDKFEVEPWGPLALKGKEQTVDVYLVLGYRTGQNENNMLI